MKQYFNIAGLCLSAFLLTFSALSQAASTSSADPGRIYGSVVETFDSGNYTYARIDSGKEKYWVASPPVSLKTGSMVAFQTDAPMYNFTSNTLDREFDVIYFVGQIFTDETGDHPAPAKTTAAAEISVDNIEKAVNGFTVSEALAQKQKLADQTILVRGVVVKYSPKVMKKNWIHIRDASSSTDLTVTTMDTVKLGDVILVSGKLQLDRDFGYGYIYDVLLEDSTVTIE